MSSTDSKAPGTIGWHDLTIENASQLKEFYQEVVGWTSEDLDMGGYPDYVMKDPKSGSPVAGVCHARGVNADLPPLWLMYVNVPDLTTSMEACKRKGGSVLHHRVAEWGQIAVIKDPSGAVMALHQGK
jgi:predicted enzyme related to lactoylglutathione lyase